MNWRNKYETIIDIFDRLYDEQIQHIEKRNNEINLKNIDYSKFLEKLSKDIINPEIDIEEDYKGSRYSGLGGLYEVHSIFEYIYKSQKELNKNKKQLKVLLDRKENIHYKAENNKE